VDLWNSGPESCQATTFLTNPCTLADTADCRTDALMAKQYEQMKLPDRPKRWKQKAFEVMNEAIHTRSEVFFYFFCLFFSVVCSLCVGTQPLLLF